MPNVTLTEDFLKKVPGTKNTLRCHDNVIDASGRFKELKGVDVIIRSLVRILMTPRGTEFFDPTFGSDIYRYVFEPMDNMTAEDIKNEVMFITTTLETRANIQATVSFLSGGQKGFVVTLTIQYQGEFRKVTVPITEELVKTED